MTPRNLFSIILKIIGIFFYSGSVDSIPAGSDFNTNIIGTG